MNKKKVFVLFLVILIIVSSIIFFILYKRNNSVKSFFDEYIFRKNILENDLPNISIESRKIFAFNNSIVCLDKNVLTFYNKNANIVDSFDINISNPIFKSCGQYLCIAEKNGSKIYLINNGNILWQKNAEGEIFNISVNKNGYVAISMSNTTYKNICKVYNDSGSELLTTYLSKSYIIDSAISTDNKFLALAEANFSGITIQSNIKVISISKALSNSTDSVEYSYSSPSGDLIINVQYDSHNNLLCLYDNHIDIIKDNSNTELTNFDKSNVLFADFNNKLIQIEKHTFGLLSSEFELHILDVNTNETKTLTLEKEPKSLQVYENIIAINFGTEALFINDSGWIIKHYKSSQEIQDITLSNNLAGIIFKNKIEFLNL